MVTSSGQDVPQTFDALLRGANPWPLPDPRRLCIGEVVYPADVVIRVLEQHVSERRRERIREVVSARAVGVAVVVEGLANLGNVSAVMRTAEALGFLPFHVVLGDAPLKTSSRTSQGAEKWLDVYRWSTPAACIDHLHAHGYRVLATHLESGRSLSACDFSSHRTALVFGNERTGISEDMLRRCDGRVVIPMCGFTRSFNISVAAAMALYHVHRARLETFEGGGDLSSEERTLLTADYLVRTLSSAHGILRRER